MEKLVIGLEWFLNPDHLPLILGIEKGWFKEHDLEIKMIEPEKHFDALEEIEKDSMDIAITEPIHLVEDKASNQNVVGFARYLHTNGGVMYNKDKGITTPKDLVGKRLQYPGAPGLGGIAIAKTMIEADGVEYEDGDITPVNNSFYHTDALLNDKADAATLIFENFEILEARSKGLNVDYFALKDYNVPDFCQLIFITTPNKLDTASAKIERFIKVIQKAIQYINTNLEDAINIYAHYTQTDIDNQLNKDTIEATAKCFTNDFSMSDDYYNDLQLWLQETGKIQQTINPKAYLTNHLLFSRHN